MGVGRRVEGRHRIMLSRWVNSVTGKRELSAQISRLRPTRILDNAGMVNMDQLRELTKQSQLLASEMQNVDKEVGAANGREA